MGDEPEKSPPKDDVQGEAQKGQEKMCKKTSEHAHLQTNKGNCKNPRLWGGEKRKTEKVGGEKSTRGDARVVSGG